MHAAVTDQTSQTGDRAIRLFLALFAVFFSLYMATADRSIPYHIDPFTNAISAATIGSSGSPILTDYSALTEQIGRAHV